MIQRHQKQPSHLDAGQLILIVLPFLFVVAGVLVSVFSFARLGTVGGEMYAMTVKTEQLESQNRKLTETLAQKESLQTTLSQAESKGFIPVAQLTRVTLQDTKMALQVSSGN